jgi:uncharacterized protein
MDVTIRGVTVRMLASRALWLPSTRTLAVADVHLGRTHLYRQRGFAIPDTDANDHQRLLRLLDEHPAQRLVILGDLLHHQDSHHEQLHEQLKQLAARAEVVLVQGNHDRNLEALSDTGVQVCMHTHLAHDVVGAHEPHLQEGVCVVAGHLHPSFSSSRGPTQVRCPAFVVGDACTVLPAFGSTTAGVDVRRLQQDGLLPVHDVRVFACADSEVVDVTSIARLTPRATAST